MNNDFFKYLIGFIVVLALWPLIKWLVLVIAVLIVILIIYLRQKIRVIRPSDGNHKSDDRHIGSDDVIDVEYKTKDGK